MGILSFIMVIKNVPYVWDENCSTDIPVCDFSFVHQMILNHKQECLCYNSKKETIYR